VTTTGTIKKIWATITPPEYKAGKTDTLPPEFNFELKSDGKGTYQKECKECFSTFGTYQVTVYAEDTEGNVSVCNKFSIYQPEGRDVYEEDDMPAQAGFIFSDESQEHNFHNDSDNDWVKFYAVTGEFYAVEVTAEENCNTFIEIYDTDGKTRLIPKNDKSPGIENGIEKWKCPKTEIYYVKIHQADPEGEDNCEDSRYFLKIYPPVAFSGGIQIFIMDSYTGEPIYKLARLTTDVQPPVDKFSYDVIDHQFGIYIDHQFGIYNVKIEVEGYENCIKKVNVEEIGTTTVTFDLKPLISLPELLRVIQLYNSGYHCDSSKKDGYAPGDGDRSCIPHHSDYNPQDWTIGLNELMRLIQFYNSDGYCSDPIGEDGFKAGKQP